MRTAEKSVKTPETKIISGYPGILHLIVMIYPRADTITNKKAEIARQNISW